jgi:hypothetical protein
MVRQPFVAPEIREQASLVEGTLLSGLLPPLDPLIPRL